MKFYSTTMNSNPRHRIFTSRLSALAITLASAVLTVAFTASSTHATIAIADTGFSTDFGNTSFTDVVVSGTNNMLVVGISGEDTFTQASPPSFSVSWGITTNTTSAITEVSSSGRNYAAIYVLSGLTAGTNDLTVDFDPTSGSQKWRAGFISLTSPDGELGIAEAVGTGGTSDSFSLNFAEDTGDKFVFGVANWNSSRPATADLAETLGDFSAAGNDFGGSMDYENTPGGTSFTYTGANNRAAITGIAVEVLVPEPSTIILAGLGSDGYLLPSAQKRVTRGSFRTVQIKLSLHPDIRMERSFCEFRNWAESRDRKTIMPQELDGAGRRYIPAKGRVDLM